MLSSGKAAEEIVAAGGQAEFHHLDARDSARTDALAAVVEEIYSRNDMVLANAGIAHKVPLAELTDERWSHTFHTDLGGVFLASDAARYIIGQVMVVYGGLLVGRY